MKKTTICGKCQSDFPSKTNRKYCEDCSPRKVRATMIVDGVETVIPRNHFVCKTCKEFLPRKSQNERYCDKCTPVGKPRKTNNGIEIEESEVLLYNYKEPLKKFEGYFGYLGTVSLTPDRNRVQCHFCGLFYKGLNNHYSRCPGVERYRIETGIIIDSARKYKEVIGLSPGTALVGEGYRASLIKNGTNTYALHKDKMFLNRPQPRTRPGKLNTLESKNRNGTCPDQLLDRIRFLSNKLGHTASKREFLTFYKTRFMSPIVMTFGNYVNAVRKAGLVPAYDNEDRWKRKPKYNKEQLIEFYQDFYKVHQRPPFLSDHSRGLLPSWNTYWRCFGSIHNARRAAGIPTVKWNHYGAYTLVS